MRRFGYSVGAFLIVAFVAFTAPVLFGSDTQVSTPPLPPLPRVAAGMRVGARASGSSAFSSSARGLFQAVSPTPGGGVMVDLQGRFMSSLVIQRDPDGNFSTRCVREHPAASVEE